ncbi:hypothetical protein JZ751_014024 [Albula glossodonta]|uniref:Uncharacterized protein n=1 Tax=Albula glossodonta TaxID=121402 RepID=A0A8T2N0F6_9TELE|nr:hypothetical protein JZ751_014024 [Albula glossodonta]
MAPARPGHSLHGVGVGVLCPPMLRTSCEPWTHKHAPSHPQTPPLTHFSASLPVCFDALPVLGIFSTLLCSLWPAGSLSRVDSTLTIPPPFPHFALSVSLKGPQCTRVLSVLRGGCRLKTEGD